MTQRIEPPTIVSSDIQVVNDEMGAGGSKAVGGLVVSLDALRTLYRFRKPVFVQYAEIAQQCGLNAQLDASKLGESFKTAFKYHNSTYPNYGKGKLDSPAVWWNLLVNHTFREVVPEKDIPNDLGQKLYDHYSSGAAYELYPDVMPFFQNMRNLKEQYSEANGPMVMVGVITNSDPRVRQVLGSLGLNVGKQQPVVKFNYAAENLKARQRAKELARGEGTRFTTPWHDYWDESNDIDFLATSYEAGHEKPNPGIFAAAHNLAQPIPMSRAEQQMGEARSAIRGVTQLASVTLSHLGQLQTMNWIHVGDEYIKDYQGAENADMEALHLVREGEGEAVDGAKTVSSLEEVSAIANLMMRENYGKQNNKI